VAGNGGYETCRPRSGTRFNISSSGLYLSSISSRDQAADYDLKNMVQRKRHRCANVYSELSHGQKVICVEENCGHNKRRKRSEKSNCTNTQYSGRDDNNLHEDTIYAPKILSLTFMVILAINSKDLIVCRYNNYLSDYD
jgi:hypothetical protein